MHSFGLLGAITEVKIRIGPEFGIRKCIYENLSWDVVNNKELFAEMLAQKDYISFFTTWENPEMTSVWTSEIIEPEIIGSVAVDYTNVCQPEFYGAKLVHHIHPVPGRSADPCVTSGLGMWYDKIYHFLPDKPPSSDGDEI